MAKRHGLLLDLPGAPTTPHTVPGYPGYYRPDVPTPVGGDGELPLDRARKADRDEGVHLKLVEIEPSEIKAAAELARRTVQEGRRGIVAARKDRPKGAEVAQVEDEQKAVKEASS